MKFSCTVDIDAPREKVVELFDNPDNLKEWQDGFQSFEHLSGEPGKPGAKSRVIYLNKGRTIELIETVLVRDPPNEFSGTYEHKRMTNSMQNFFEDLNNGRTRWRAEIEYTRLNGFMIKLMVLLFPGMFKKQVQKWLDQFKDFVERS